MKFGLQTHWDDKNESIDSWLNRERKACDLVENPTCPWCERVHRDWWEISGLSDWDVDDYEMDCDDCGNKFLVKKGTQVRFEVRKKDNPQSADADSAKENG